MPIIACIKKESTKKLGKTITKRSLKNFTIENCERSLLNQSWEELEKTENCDEMVDMFKKKIQSALDEIAQIKMFKIKNNYKFGLSEDTKNKMKQRDSAKKG